jgi:hypothetical protein
MRSAWIGIFVENQPLPASYAHFVAGGEPEDVRR